MGSLSQTIQSAKMANEEQCVDESDRRERSAAFLKNNWKLLLIAALVGSVSTFALIWLLISTLSKEPVSTTSTTTTTTTKASLLGTEVLVLSTYSWDDVPIITNAAGRQDTNFDFVFGEGTEVDYSCSMNWKNELYIFGGRSKKRQISKLIGCQLTRIGELEFDHYLGACANVADAKLYLCFNDASGDYGKCRVALSPTGIFDEINRSIHNHAFTRIAASEDDILALGSVSPFHKRAEILRTDGNTWLTIGDYPYSLANNNIIDAPIIYTDGAFYVFGGYSGGNFGGSSIKSIGKLDATTFIWSKVGDLYSGRYGHNVIFDGAHFLVIGGLGTKKTEKCTLVNGQMTCAEQNSELSEYAFYPELYMVPSDSLKGTGRVGSFACE